MMQLTSSAYSQLEAGLSNLKHVKLVNSCAHYIKLKVHDMCTLLTIPAWYLENNCSENRGSEWNEEGEEVFMLTLSSEDDPEDRLWLPIFLQSTNERLERIRNGSEVVKFVVEGIHKALSSVVQLDTDEENIDSEKAEDDDDGEDDREEDDYWYDDTATDIDTQSEQVLGIRKSSKLYLMAQAAAKTCRDRFLISGPSDSGNEQWCFVHPNPGTCAVRLQIEVAGLVDNVEAPISLGIPVAGSCLEIKLQFSSDQWCSKLLDTLECSVGACSVKGLSKEARDEEGPRKASWKSYGLSCFVPEFISRFLKQWGSRNKSISEQERIASTRNTQPVEEQANLFLDLLNHICMKLKTLCQFCPICFTSLPCEVGRLRPCNKDLCLYKFEELGLLTSIMSELEAPQIVELELSMALSAARATADVFEPFPGYLLGHREARGRNGWFTDTRERSRMEWSTTNKDVLKLQMALNAIPELTELQKCKDEAELKDRMAVHWAEQKEKPPIVAPEDVSSQQNLPYNLLHFVLSTNRCSMLNLDQEERLDIGVDATAQIMIINDSPEREAEFNNKRDKRGSFYAFHGSVGSNWYSILRNGLRSMSATKYMAVGAAYGSGIYLGTNIGTSALYSKSSAAAFGWSHSPYRNGLYCIAIVEAITGCLAQDRVPILVVKPQEERSVMIRYLLVFNSTPVFATNITCSGKVMHGIPDKSIDLSKHFNDVKSRWEARGAAEKEVRKTRCFEALKWKVALEAQAEQERERAFSREQEPPLSSPTEQTPPILRRPAPTQSLPANLQAIQIRVHKADEAPENSLLTWRVHFMPQLFQVSRLGRDLAEAAALRSLQTLPLTLEIIYPFYYPNAPPFVHVVSPHFMFHTGHITLGGSICMELLTASGWLPTYSIESVLVSILAEMHGGGTRLDRQRTRSAEEYPRAEAKESFERAAVTHGWKTGLVTGQGN